MSVSESNSCVRNEGYLCQSTLLTSRIKLSARPPRTDGQDGQTGEADRQSCDLPSKDLKDTSAKKITLRLHPNSLRKFNNHTRKTSQIQKPHPTTRLPLHYRLSPTTHQRHHACPVTISTSVNNPKISAFRDRRVCDAKNVKLSEIQTPKPDRSLPVPLTLRAAIAQSICMHESLCHYEVTFDQYAEVGKIAFKPSCRGDRVPTQSLPHFIPHPEVQTYDADHDLTHSLRNLGEPPQQVLLYRQPTGGKPCNGAREGFEGHLCAASLMHTSPLSNTDAEYVEEHSPNRKDRVQPRTRNSFSASAAEAATFFRNSSSHLLDRLETSKAKSSMVPDSIISECISELWPGIVSTEFQNIASESRQFSSQTLPDIPNFGSYDIKRTSQDQERSQTLTRITHNSLRQSLVSERICSERVHSGREMPSRGLSVEGNDRLFFISVTDGHPAALASERDENLSYDAEDYSAHWTFFETTIEFKQRLIHWIAQMMYVSGETAEPSAETTWMIEEVVREQVLEMLKEATVLANRRGSKSISIVDLIFQIRHNHAKVSRLKTFLSWKDVRKNVKDSDDKGGGDADAIDLEDSANLPGAGPSSNQKSSANKRAKLVLPWEVQSFFSETVPERDDEEDEEEEEQNDATLARLAAADERTKNMTKDEYVYWSDCRQASFTFRKGKRFREWAGFGTIIDSKPNDDVVDILGFLTFEIVQTLTEEALKVKAAEDLANKKANSGRSDADTSKKRKREGCSLFEMPEEGRTPVEPKHVREAFRRLQSVPNKYKYMRQGYAGMRTPLRLI